MTETDELLEKAEAWGQTLGEHLESIIELARAISDRISRLEQRVGQLESGFEKIPWIPK